MNPELEQFTIDELMDEVRARHHHVLCLTVRDGKVASENLDIVTRYLKGPNWALIGLAAVFQTWATQQFVDAPDSDE